MEPVAKAESGVNITDFVNRTTQITSISADFITQWWVGKIKRKLLYFLLTLFRNKQIKSTIIRISNATKTLFLQ